MKGLDMYCLGIGVSKPTGICRVLGGFKAMEAIVGGCRVQG